MTYTFEILGVSPMLNVFNHQQELLQQPTPTGVEYLSSQRCTLDALIESVEAVPPERGWNLDQAVDTVINFWMNNVETVYHWKQRLEDAGEQNLIVSRLADLRSLQAEFERLFK
ncbi:MAG: hypothetical protein HC866_09215 [Leptolyngbyaceae cyanobacterium RU_5_1]|nr:hypothetical protein [Leptolyngbyaceae cyanobacterium RU_5_1]